MMGAKLAGAQRIIAIDISDEKLGSRASSAPPTPTTAGEADCVAQVRAATGVVRLRLRDGGQHQALTLASEILVLGGSVVSAGLPPASAAFGFNPNQLVSDENAIRGSYRARAYRSGPAGFIELYKQGRLPIDRLKSGTLPLEDINAGFDRLAVAAVRRSLRSRCSARWRAMRLRPHGAQPRVGSSANST